MRLSSTLGAFALLAVSAILLPAASNAAPTTSTRQVSVAQIFEMVELSATNAMARNAVIAYLAGVGETSGLLFAEGQRHGANFTCARSISLSQEVAVAALNAAAPDKASWAETPATPIIVADMFVRGDCR